MVSKKRIEEISAEAGLSSSDTVLAIEFLQDWCRQSGFEMNLEE